MDSAETLGHQPIRCPTEQPTSTLAAAQRSADVYRRLAFPRIGPLLERAENSSDPQWALAILAYISVYSSID